MVNIIRAVCVAVTLLCLPKVAAAQFAPSREEPGQAARTGIVAVTPPVVATSASLRRQGGTLSRGRDGLWNGALIGAGLGALLGALGGEVLIDCTECAGFNVPLTFGVLGAGVGAGVGAGIDALRHTRSPVPYTPARVTVIPVLGKAQRAVVARVRF